MDEGSFHSDKAGRVEWSDNGQFCYFRPNTLPLDIEAGGMSKRTLRTVSAISRLDGRVSGIPEEERFIILNSFAIKEATTSSAIEGSRSTVSDIFKEEKEKEADVERASDNQEVRNYKEALLQGIRGVSEEGRITEGLLLSMHGTLLKGARGGDKRPGAYRDGLVWVGGRGDTLETAEYVPTPPFAIQYLMDDLLDYMDRSDDDPIRKIAVSHYQFEAIHPFKDGNGRMGRLIMMLLLHKEGLMESPFLYISEYLNKHRGDYIGHLTRVRTDGDLQGWLGFLLDALDSQTARSMRLLESIRMYKKAMRELALRENSGTLDSVGGMLIENPFITVGDITGRTGVSAPTARKLINVLLQNGVLDPVEGKRRGMLYKATAVLDMLERV
ncbi:MAG: Fic family protein [Methanomassiliicoccaceae archaeon]|nr:Fic family protein [Methanomassiliicoccaceae archaeon]